MKKVFKYLGIAFLAYIVIGLVIQVFSPDESEPVTPAAVEKATDVSKYEILINGALAEGHLIAARKRLEESILEFPADTIFYSTMSSIIDAKELQWEKEMKQNEKKKAAAQEKLSTLKKNCDEFKAACFYQDRRSPSSIGYNGFFLYLVEQGDSYFLRLKMQYVAEDWLFVDNVKLNIDGDIVDFYSGDFERDNNQRIYEYKDIRVSAGDISTLRKVANSKSTVARYEGRQFYKDKTVTMKQKSALKKMLDVYESLVF